MLISSTDMNLLKWFIYWKSIYSFTSEEKGFFKTDVKFSLID